MATRANACLAKRNSITVHLTADGYEVSEGENHWDNGLNLVTVTKVANYSETNRNPDSPDYGRVTWWHDTTRGMADGSRLAKRHPFTGKIAGTK